MSTPNADSVRDECSLCEGEGQVAQNFDLFSDGVPDIVPCPKCDGTGEEIDGSEPAA